MPKRFGDRLNKSNEKAGCIDGDKEGRPRLMDDAEFRDTLGEAARESVRRYAPDAVVGRWERLFALLTSGPAAADAEGASGQRRARIGRMMLQTRRSAALRRPALQKPSQDTSAKSAVYELVVAQFFWKRKQWVWASPAWTGTGIVFGTLAGLMKVPVTRAVSR
jgi:hypothetical protein